MPKPERIPPGPGQESVWDYPRPPRVEDSTRQVEVWFNDACIAQSRRARRVLETSGPPVYYLPPEDVRGDCLSAAGEHTWCEWKGRAEHFDVNVGDRQARLAAWCYPTPTPGYEPIAGWIAFYPGRVDACTLDGELVRPQPGHYYGGWITDEILGPFKGEPGTEGW